MREKSFWKMTWNEYQRQVNKHLLAQWRHWDRTRRIACESYNNMNEKPLTYEKYLPLPTDRPDQQAAKRAAANLAFLDEMKRKGRI